MDVWMEDQVSRRSTDNEYSQTPELNAEYFADLEDQYRENDVVVPLWGLLLE